MKVTIDLDNKIITLLEEANVDELTDFLELIVGAYEGDWKVNPSAVYNTITYPTTTPQYPYPTPVVPLYNPPYHVDSTGNYNIEPTSRVVSEHKSKM